MFFRVLKHQITHLKVIIEDDIIVKVTDDLEINLFAMILFLGKCLKHFQLLSGRRLKHPTFNLTPEQRIKLKSLSLIQLKISVNTIGDCLYLLDEDLECLSTLIIDINEISDSSYINNT
ncbi:unnamed protein product, partial [Rotaria sordida]